MRRISGWHDSAAMQWWRSPVEWLERFDDAEWPDGVPWPKGAPSQRPEYIRKLSAMMVAPIGAGMILIAAGSPEALTFALVSLMVAASAGYAVRESVREAKRQGWGRNLGW